MMAIRNINGVACIDKNHLLEVVSENVLRNMVIRKQVSIVVRGCRNTPAQYAVDSLPERHRAAVYRRFPKPAESQPKNVLERTIRLDNGAFSYFHNHKLEDGRYLPPEVIRLYINNASILEGMRELRRQSDSIRKQGGKKGHPDSRFYPWMADLLAGLTDEWTHSLPLQPRPLKARYEKYISEGYASLIHRNYGNKSAAKVVSEEQEAVLVKLLAHHNHLEDTQVAKLYNEVAGDNGWKTLTARRIGDWRRSRELLVSAGRLGESKFRLAKHTSVKRMKPTKAMRLWSHDGWEVELYYRDYTNKKGGDRVMRSDMRLVVEVILDPVCNYPVGYAIGTRENPALIKHAMLNALTHTEELFGVMIGPDQMQYDQYGIKVLKPLYESIADLQTPARVGNAKSKPVEQYFSYLNREYCQLQPNWSGTGITSKRGKQPNRDALEKLKGDFPDRARVEVQIREIIQAERAKKRAEYVSMFDGDVTRLEISKAVYLEHWGDTTGRYHGQETYGLCPTILGSIRRYESFDLEFKKLAHLKWQVYYDPFDLREVLAVSEDGQHKFSLSEKHLPAMAVRDLSAQDRDYLGRVFDFQSETERWVASTLGEMTPLAQKAVAENKIASRLLEHEPVPFARKKKDEASLEEYPEFVKEKDALMTDSEGQHKNNRYDRKEEREGKTPSSAPTKRRSVFERV
ncbi:hypothetical protein [Porphyromonas loveana]|uniref:hypothetical protein n=1 Tax=Porphyromonas loveana TaxID=1884669 RepID=UPI0035A02AFE